VAWPYWWWLHCLWFGRKCHGGTRYQSSPTSGSLIVFWLICGVIAAAIRSAKNRSAFGWFVLGPLFAPSILIVVAIPMMSKSAFPTPGGESSWLVQVWAIHRWYKGNY
jgi:hypothetical protein